MTDIAELRRLLGEATPGPWAISEIGSGFEIESSDGLFVAQAFQTKPIRSAIDHQERRANAALIVAAVNALPALLERLEAAGRDAVVLDALQSHIDKHGGIVLHNGTYGAPYNGLGLANTKRTLRQAVCELIGLDAAMKEPNHEG